MATLYPVGIHLSMGFIVATFQTMNEDESNLEAMFRGRCTHEQKRRWEQAAKLAKRSLSDWLRIIADEAADQALEQVEKRKK